MTQVDTPTSASSSDGDPNVTPLNSLELRHELFQAPALSFMVEPTSPGDVTTTDALSVNPSPSPAPTPFPVTLTSHQQTELLNSKHVHQTCTFAKSQVGGTSPAEVLTGFGAGEKKDPQSARCMREFDTNVVKSYISMDRIEDKSHLGLHGLFSTWNEPNTNMVDSSITAFEERMIQHGMEGVFHVVGANSKVMNMLQEPGRFTAEAIDTWCLDLLNWGLLERFPKSLHELQILAMGGAGNQPQWA